MLSLGNFITEQKGVMSREGIAYQKDDWFVKNLVANVQGIFDAYEAGRVTDIDNYVMDIEDDIFKRFGIKTKIITNKSDLLVEMFGFDTDAGLIEMKRIVNQITRRYDRLKEKGRNISRVEQGILKNNRVLNSWVGSNVLKIDEDNARIEGLPTAETEFGKFSAYMHVNFENFVLGSYSKKDIGSGPQKPTAEELAAGILHEIGHMFGFISYTYKTRNSFIIFEDTIRDQIRKGASDKRAFLLAYREAYEKDLNIKKYENDETEKVIIAKFKNLANNVYKTDKYAYMGIRDSSVNNELHADQFCNRFGMGKELSSFILKFSLWEANVSANLKKIFFGIIMVYLAFCVVLELISVAALGAILLFGYGYFIGAMTDALSVIFKLKGGYTYDTPYKRVERVYLDVIRNIRMNIQDESVRRELVNNAIAIKDVMEEMASIGMTSTGLEANLLTKAIEFFNSDLKNSRLMAIMDNDLEKIMENDLYLSYGMINEE